jgi:hypothetical protein
MISKMDFIIQRTFGKGNPLGLIIDVILSVLEFTIDFVKSSAVDMIDLMEQLVFILGVMKLFWFLIEALSFVHRYLLRSPGFPLGRYGTHG